MRAGQLGVFWAAVPHHIVQTAPGSKLYWLTIPLGWFLQWQLPTRLTQKVLSGELLLNDAQNDLALFRQWQLDLQIVANFEEHRKLVLLEAEARLRRLALTANFLEKLPVKIKESWGGTNSTLQTKVEQIAAFIAEHFQEQLDVQTIADEVQLDPAYTMRLFRKTLGMTILEYLTQHRLAYAQRLLVTSDNNVLDVALEAGFGSLSRFYAVFTRACHQSPQAYRKSLQLPPK